MSGGVDWGEEKTSDLVVGVRPASDWGAGAVIYF